MPYADNYLPPDVNWWLVIPLLVLSFIVGPWLFLRGVEQVTGVEVEE